MRLNKKSAVAAMCLALAGCGMFGKEKLQIDGERIPVLSEREVIAADYTAGDIQIVLPKPAVNAVWPQSGGNASHNMGHLKRRQSEKGLEQQLRQRQFRPRLPDRRTGDCRQHRLYH